MSGYGPQKTKNKTKQKEFTRELQEQIQSNRRKKNTELEGRSFAIIHSEEKKKKEKKE